MHVLFDLNGTLLDPGGMTAGWPGAPRGVALRALDDAVAQAMVDTMTGEFRPFLDYLHAALAHLAAIAGLPDEAVEQAATVARGLPPFPEAADALRRLGDAGHTASVVTNSAAKAAGEALEAADLMPYISTITGADAVNAYKPDRRLYEAGLTTVGSAAGDTWLVAGHWWDVAGAKRAGLRTAWVGRDEGVLLETVPPPDALGPDLVAVVEAIIASP
jgi:2-haloacid dehalogenase